MFIKSGKNVYQTLKVFKFQFMIIQIYFFCMILQVCNDNSQICYETYHHDAAAFLTIYSLYVCIF